MSFSEKRIGVIGAGSMANAMIRGFLDAKLIEPESITASDINEDILAKIREGTSVATTLDNKIVVQNSRILILAIKPIHLLDVLSEVSSFITPEHLVISVAAGVSIITLEEKLPQGVPVIRVMPNVPALIGEGMTVLTLGSKATQEEQRLANLLFSSLGKVLTLEEKFMDAVTGLSGSGPAYMAIMLDALADGGVKMGLSRQVALELAVQTMLGTAKMIQSTGEHPALFKERVFSPAGTTVSGVHVLEKCGMRGILISAVEAAAKRSEELR